MVQCLGWNDPAQATFVEILLGGLENVLFRPANNPCAPWFEHEHSQKGCTRIQNDADDKYRVPVAICRHRGAKRHEKRCSTFGGVEQSRIGGGIFRAERISAG